MYCGSGPREISKPPLSLNVKVPKGHCIIQLTIDCYFVDIVALFICGYYVLFVFLAV